jgi:hypothetical protein
VSGAPWRVQLTRTAQRDLRRLDPPVRKRVEVALRALAEDPQRAGALRKPRAGQQVDPIAANLGGERCAAGSWEGSVWAGEGKGGLWRHSRAIRACAPQHGRAVAEQSSGSS